MSSPALDWLWPIYEEHIRRVLCVAKGAEVEQPVLQQQFFKSLGASSATLYVMEPVGDTIRFKGLGRWTLAEVPDLLADPNGFIAEGFRLILTWLGNLVMGVLSLLAWCGQRGWDAQGGDVSGRRSLLLGDFDSAYQFGDCGCAYDRQASMISQSPSSQQLTTCRM